MNTNQSEAQVIYPDAITLEDYRVRREARRYMRRRIWTGVKVSLMIAGAAAVANHFRDKEDTDTSQDY